MKIRNNSQTVLIVEDDRQTIEMLQLGLIPNGFICVTAVSGREALKLLDKSQPDIILLDIMLPDIDGYELCTIIKERTQDTFVPIIAITARNDVESIVKGLNCGADDYVTKPYEMIEVIARVQAMLRVKVLHDLLNEKKEKLEELHSIKDEFLSICSHDLKNIIMPVMEASSMMRENLVPANNTKFADIIYRQSKKMVTLLNNLLHSFKTQGNSPILCCEIVDVRAFFEEYIRDCSMMYRARSLKISIDIDKEVDTWVFDKEKIDEVLTNLISNAAKYTPSGGTIHVRVTIDHGNNLAVSVIDSGRGIPRAILPRIFDKFVTTPSDENKNGVGLGLAICKTIVEKHGGSIHVKSKEGEGSEFSFTIPQQRNSSGVIRPLEAYQPN
ncbi:MAG: response regulator [bacterium]|nr:response regulator [bacterium]